MTTATTDQMIVRLQMRCARRFLDDAGGCLT